MKREPLFIPQIDGQPYWNFEYLVRKAPTKTVILLSSSIISTNISSNFLVCSWFLQLLWLVQAQESNSYRHYVASTTERDGNVCSFLFMSWYCNLKPLTKPYRKLIAGYLYSINASTLNKQWTIVTLSLYLYCYIHLLCLQTKIDEIFVMQLGPILKKTADSFHLLPPTENYVPPFKDPWRFWWLHTRFSCPTSANLRNLYSTIQILALDSFTCVLLCLKKFLRNSTSS